jgi:hypothetical protein
MLKRGFMAHTTLIQLLRVPKTVTYLIMRVLSIGNKTTLFKLFLVMAWTSWQLLDLMMS